MIRKNWSLAAIIILTPLLLWAVLYILPTHDDWAGTTKPDFSPFFTKEHFFYFGYHWRPFDTWIGYINGRNPQLLFPAFNHILVVLGHALCTVCLWQMMHRLQFSTTSRNIASFCFFIIPATMATVTAVDSQNQTYALIFGIISLLVYIRQDRLKYALWPLTIFLSALFKENGLMWVLIGPILAFGFNIIDRKTLLKDIIIAIAIMAFYALLIFIQPKDIIIHPEYEPEPMKMVNNIVKFIFSSFFIVDYDYLLHQPHRNLYLAALSLLLSIPFMLLLIFSNKAKWISKPVAAIILSMIIAVSPHLLTIFSMMHTYAGLPFLALLMAYAIDNGNPKHKPLFIVPFFLFVATSIAIDVHLISQSIKSGRIGKKMAQDAISKTGQPVDKVLVVIIEDDYPKLSSFCVIPNEAFGWGQATKYENNYQWPKEVSDTIIARTPNALSQAKEISSQLLQQSKADCIWIVDHADVYVVRP